MIQTRNFIRSILLWTFLVIGNLKANAQADDYSPGLNAITAYWIIPSETDSTIKEANTPHLVMYDPFAPLGKLLLFMTGTGGKADRGPGAFFRTAVKQGYRVISLSYIDTPAIAQVCRGRQLVNDPDCAAEVRAKRAFGLKTTVLIDDQPQDAIFSRFIMLLRYLATYDKNGNWGNYLNEKGNPKWNLIAVSGQSQGGGMAAFIAKCTLVDRVIDFSGGWDYSESGRIAKWYYGESKTPPDRWYGAYHVDEETARTILDTYKAMGIPEDHIKALNLHVRKHQTAHTEGAWNDTYKPVWIEMLGSGQ